MPTSLSVPVTTVEIQNETSASEDEDAKEKAQVNAVT